MVMLLAVRQLAEKVLETVRGLPRTSRVATTEMTLPNIEAGATATRAARLVAASPAGHDPMTIFSGREKGKIRASATSRDSSLVVAHLPILQALIDNYHLSIKAIPALPLCTGFLVLERRNVMRDMVHICPTHFHHTVPANTSSLKCIVSRSASPAFCPRAGISRRLVAGACTTSRH